MHAYLELYQGAKVRIVTPADDRLTIGRAPSNEIAIESEEVSRLHAVLERFPSGWTIRDLGSTNGTMVNGAVLSQSQILRDGDEVRIGPGLLVFRAASEYPSTSTVQVSSPPEPPILTRREHEVIAALCRPFVEATVPFPEPPSVRRLAADLSLSESAVKKHLANLYDKFGLRTADERRRSHLAGEAVRRRVVTVRPTRG